MKIGYATWLGTDGLKQLVQARDLSVQRNDEGPSWYVFALDGGVVHEARIMKDDGEDQTDFESSFAALTGRAVSAMQFFHNRTEEAPTADDGRLAVRVTTASRTKNFKLRAFAFYSANANSLHNVNPLTDADYGDISITLKKWDGSAWVTSEEPDATKTIVDFDPLYAYEIIGGWIDLPSDLKDGTTDQWYLACIGLPDYAVYGIAVDFVNEVNLEAVTTTKVEADGRATQYLSPTIVGGVNYLTNRMRLVVKHPAGAQKRFQFFIEHFTG